MSQLRTGLACALVAAASLLAVPAYGAVIGTDDFSYPDGSIDGQTGGTGWDWDNTTQTHTGTASDWDGGTVSGGAVVTANSTALRQYNGPTEGSASGTDERLGAFQGSGTVYYSVQYTQNDVNLWSGISSYDFGTERIFWGQPGGQDAADPKVFGIQVHSGAPNPGLTYSVEPVIVGQTYNLVSELDFDNNVVRMWVNPTQADLDDPVASRTYDGTNWSTAVRVGSGATTTWDNLTVADNWNDLGLPALSDTLINPSFEEGSTGWRTYNLTAGAAGEFVSGDHFGMTATDGSSFWSDVRSYDINGTGNHKGVYQRVATVAGEDYTLAADVQAFSNNQAFGYLAGQPSTNPFDNQVRIGIDPTGGTDPTAGSVVWTADYDTGAMWQDVSLDFTATGGVTTVFLDAWPKWALAGNWSGFDNIRLTGGGGPSGLILDVTLSGSGLAPEGAVIEHGTFGEDALAFTDRTHEWNSDPGQPTIDELGLTGADYIRFANDDRSPTDFMADVELAEGTKDLYLLIDQRISDPNVQNILNGNAFVDTGVLIGVDESGDGDIDNTSRLFLLENFTGTSIMLGPQGQGGTNMYGFVATAGAAAVPEPSTLALLIVGAAGLLLLRRRPR